MTPRIYFPGSPEPGESLELPADQLRYLRNVLRLSSGDTLILFDGRGFEYSAVITGLGGRRARVKITAKNRVPEAPGPKLTLAQALPKGAKLEWIIQKATELGASGILPFTSARAIPKIQASKMEDRLSRWRKIAAEAAEQCGRFDVPEIHGIVTFEKLLERPATGSLKIIFWEAESERSLREVLGDNAAGIQDVFVVVGPEGGFAPGEIDRARAAGFVTASLGRRVLRVETAALAVLAILQYSLGGFTGPGKTESEK